MRPSLLLAACLLLAAAARGGVIHVPKDQPTIQAGVDAAADGDTVLVAAGTYPEAVVVLSRTGLVLRGQGQALISGAPSDIGLTFDDCTACRADNLRFSGIDLAVKVVDSTGVVVSRCRGTDMSESGFLALTSTDTLLDRCTLDGVPDLGLSIVQCFGCIVRRCTLLSVNTGVSVGDCTAVELDHVRVENTPGTALFVSIGCVATDVHDCRFSNIGINGVSLDCSDGHFRHDVVDTVDGAGFHLSSTALRNVLEGEKVIGAGGNAFELSGSMNELHDCRAVTPGADGIALLDQGQHVVEGCRIVSPVGDGVSIDAFCNGCSLRDNRISKAGGNGFITVGKFTEIIGNVATSCTDNGFRIASSDDIIIGNSAHGSGGFDLKGFDTDAVYLDNHFGTVSP